MYIDAWQKSVCDGCGKRRIVVVVETEQLGKVLQRYKICLTCIHNACRWLKKGEKI